MKRSPRLLPALVLLLAACGEPAPPPADAPLDPAAILGGGAEGFLRAEAPRAFRFPEDHGAHPGFRNEWWYLTGNLKAADGREFGYQVTFFRTSLVPPGPAPAGPDSAWRSDDIWMAHAALTDVAGGGHMAVERFSRANPGLAGARAEPFEVWLEDWRLASDDGAFPWRLDLRAEDFSLSLAVTPAKAPVPQGEGGLSRKSADPGNASHYYSFTRLETGGEILVGGERIAVEGLSWLDREWSTSALAADQSGWDWFSLQFEDGTELMYYQLRDRAGGAHPYSLGNITSTAATQTLLRPADIRLRELQSWTSPAGIAYTTTWRLEYADRRLRVRALLEDQWMDLSVRYWEGAVEVLDEDSGARVGRGYLEMVR